MKQCISRIKEFLIHLWRTLKQYVLHKDLNIHVDINVDECSDRNSDVEDTNNEK